MCTYSQTAQLKYTIKEKLTQLPGNLMTNKYSLCITLEISEKTLDNWMNTSKAAKFSIPSDQFFKIAAFLKTNYTDLLSK